jgi:hypothetical protein
MNQLEPCPQCRRHVLVSETVCPFCASSLSGAFANQSRPVPQTRLGRAAVFAFGVVALTQGACEHGSRPPDAGTASSDGGRDAGVADGILDDGDTGVPIYAAAPTIDGGAPTRG